MARKKKEGAIRPTQQTVTIRILSKHLQQIVLQLHAVIRAAEEIAEQGQPSLITPSSRVRPPILVGDACHPSIAFARQELAARQPIAPSRQLSRKRSAKR